MNKNIKLYKWYIGLTYDFLFFLMVQVFFLTQVKHISMSDVLLLESIFAIIRLIIQIPLTKLTKIIGTFSAFRLGPMFSLLSLVLYLIAPNFICLIIASLFKAIGWGLQNLSNPILVADELKTLGKESEYTKIQGEARSIFILFNIITSFIAGFLFEVNPYLPIILCIIIHIIVIILSFKIKKPKNMAEFSKDVSILKNIKLIITDKFFFTLFFFSMTIWGVLGAFSTYNNDYLKTIGLPISMCVIVLALTDVFGFFCSKYQYKIQRIFGSKIFYALAFAVTVPFIILGILFNLNLPFTFLLVFGLIALILCSFSRSQFRTYSLDYINKYGGVNSRTEAVGVYYMFESIGMFTITFFASLILKYNNIGTSYIILLSVLGTLLFYLAYKLSIYIKMKND